MQLQTSMQSALVNIFCIDLLQFAAGTYEATASTAAVVSHLKRFWRTSVRFDDVWKEFLPRPREKGIAIIS